MLIFKLDEKGQALILLSSLSLSIDNFINSIMCSTYTLSLACVKYALNSRKLRTKLGVHGKNI